MAQEKESLSAVIKKLNSKFDLGNIKIGVEYEELDRIPFSSPRLNYMTYGGIPVGRIIEFSGDDGSGKTTTALDCIKNAQQKFEDKQVVFCDIERTFDTDWAVKLGVNIDELIYYNPENQDAEEVFNSLIALANTGSISLIVLDSIGAMVSSQANEKKIGERTYGGISMALTEFAKKITPICAREKCTLIGINQMRDDMNSSYGAETTTGGKNWRHQCSMRIQFRKGDFLDEKGGTLTRSCENPVGNKVLASLLKSKVCVSDRRTGYYTLNYLTGIDYVSDTIELAIKYGIIQQAGSWFNILNDNNEIAIYNKEELKFHGKGAVSDFLSLNEECFLDLYNRVQDAF